MKWITAFVLTIPLIGCYREKVTSAYINTPVQTIDCNVPAGQVVLQGTYQGKNIYVQNPYSNCTDTTIRFCTESVTINDSISLPKDTIAASAYRIPLTSFGFKEGDPITIVIKHFANCTPKVLNPEVH